MGVSNRAFAMRFTSSALLIVLVPLDIAVVGHLLGFLDH
jgi:hypothetical protein